MAGSAAGPYRGGNRLKNLIVIAACTVLGVVIAIALARPFLQARAIRQSNMRIQAMLNGENGKGTALGSRVAYEESPPGRRKAAYGAGFVQSNEVRLMAP